VTTLELAVICGGVVAAVALALLATTRPARRKPETGAVLGWSPRQEQADTSGDELTPTGLLETEPPAVLDDGTVCGARGLPSWVALSTDTHHALDLRFAIALAQFGDAFDESAAEFDARMDELVTDFHRRRDDMARVEADLAELLARLDDERLRLMVGAA
jgi:hypothetical protein